MHRSIWRDPMTWGIFACLLILIVLGIVEFAGAQEHEHGQRGVPDWYDSSCCNLQDCRAVPDSEIEFLMQGGSDFVRHIPTGLMFQRSQWKLSQDERYHVCIHDDGAGEDGDNMKRPLCVYIRAGA